MFLKPSASNSRVAVTGIGLVSPIGSDIETFDAALKSGRSGIKKNFRPNGTIGDFSVMAAPVQDFKIKDELMGKVYRRGDRFSKFALSAALDAFKDAGLTRSEMENVSNACIIGASVGGHCAQDSGYQALLLEGKNVPPLTLLQTLPNAPASLVSILLGLKGPTFAISSACASSAHSIGLAAQMIAREECQVALAGGAEASLTFGGLSSWASMKILTDDKCRPFDKNRNGLAVGEGAGILVLENYERAVLRGVRIYAEIIGYGMSSDAFDMVNASTEGGIAALQQATFNLDADSPVYINAHGTGTRANDVLETAIIKSVFGSRAYDMKISSTKSMHGHLLAAAGAVESIATILALRGGYAPPTINYETPDEECDLNYVPNTPQYEDFKYGICNSFAFGGLNAVLMFQKPKM